MSGGKPRARRAAAAKTAPSRQWAVFSRRTSRGDQAVPARWYGRASRKRCMSTGVFNARNWRSSAEVNSDGSGIGQIRAPLLFASRLMIGGPLPYPDNDEFGRAQRSHADECDEAAVIDVVLGHGRAIAANEEGLLRLPIGEN